jgi:tricorn protease
LEAVREEEKALRGIACLLFALWGMVPASGEVVFPRHPAPSPDGSLVAFSYQGDVWVVSSRGGEARRLTAHPAYDAYPVWSPDGRWIAFASDRDGNYDVYVVPVDSGMVRRLTYHSDPDIPCDWLPDGSGIVFATRREIRDGWNRSLYRVPFTGGTPFPYLPVGGRQAALSPDGQRVVFVRGSVPWWRRGYEGNGRYRLWLYDAAADTFLNLSASDPDSSPGVQAHPAWFPDGRRILYLAERDGVANLEVLDVQEGHRWPVTHFQEGRLRFPRLARNGRLVAFEYEEGIYVLDLPAGLTPTTPLEPPRKLEIRLPRDATAPLLQRIEASDGAEEMAISPDGRQIAFVIHGEIFVMKASEEEPWAMRITEHPARDFQIQWMPDGKSLLFVSDREGQRDIYLVRSTDPEEPRLARSLHREIVRLTDDPREDSQPKPSPDGERIAFVRGNGDLMTMKADGSDERLLVSGWAEPSFSWSPDSRWIAFSRDDNEFNTDVWIVSADGEVGPVNVSQHPDVDQDPVWSADGRVLAFSSRRTYTNQMDIYYVWLRKEDDEKAKMDLLDEGDEEKDEEEEDGGEAKVEVRIDFQDIHKRLRRLTSFPGEESRVLVARDGKEFVFVSNTDRKWDLWKIRWDGKKLERLTEGGLNPRFLQWGPEGKKVFFLEKGGKFASVKLDGGKVTRYPFEAHLTVDRRAERAQVFDEAWRQIRDHFYDPKMHGADWEAARAKYRPWALAAGCDEDFREVIRLMLGELNASHLEINPPPSDRPGAATGALGVLFDPEHPGPGLRVAHVVPRTPADREESRLEPGDVILAVNGHPVGPDANIHRWLDGTVDRKILLRVRRGNGREEDVVIRPMAAGAFRRRLYEEEVERRRRFVEEATGGRVAYAHIAGMGIRSLETFERDLYAVAHGRDALIVDVRNNGGGWTTDLLLTILMAADHAVTVPRDGGPGYPQGRRLLYAWPKPIVAMCNEFSFSNAEIFSWSIKTLRRGPLVGQQTYGGVISTGGTRLMDGSWLRLPFRGWYTKYDGSNMERVGCTPDIVVENLPGDIARGRDPQLEAAVREALALVR